MPKKRIARQNEERKADELIAKVKTQKAAQKTPREADAEAHIRSAHQILKALQEKIGEHPEIGAAITKLEMALNDLAIQTGGLL
jgi:hypothetical protein